MAMDNWRSIFPAHIRQRGMEYYREGRVQRVWRDGCSITAEVRGTKLYTVSVLLDAETHTVEDFMCSCPYAENDDPCKHLAALLCMLEAEGEFDDEEAVPHTLTTEEAVGMLSEAQLRELLLFCAKQNPALREKIRRTVMREEPHSPKEWWKADLEELTFSAADRYGFIDYDKAYDYCRSLVDYLDDRVPDLLDKRMWKAAFELTCLVFTTAMAQDMDDSDGGLTVLAHICMDFWSDILKTTDLPAHREIFRWLIDHRKENDLTEMFLEEYLSNAPWAHGLAPEMLDELDRQIEGLQTGDGDSYRLKELILCRLQWMKRTGADRTEIDRFMCKYHHLPAVREIEFAEAMAAEDYAAALRLLEESEELDREYRGLANKYAQRKIEIYEIIRDRAALRTALEQYVCAFSQRDLTYVERLKAICAPEEWSALREKLLSSQALSGHQYAFMVSEGLLDRLMTDIEEKVDLRLLQRYEDILRPDFAERCVEVYVKWLNQSMMLSGSRQEYRSVVQTMKELRGYPGGIPAAQAVAGEWRLQYPRRTAMLDELNKAGF